MNVTVFAVSFSIMMIGMVAFLLTGVKTLPVVKAGKVTKICSKTKRLFGYMPDKINVNGAAVDLRQDDKMIVNGNSMKNHGISDGQRIYVKKYTDAEKRDIKKYPVLVLRILDNPIANDTQFKLRKFVGYARSSDWESTFIRLQPRIKIPKEEFVRQCHNKFDKMPNAEKTHLVISETFDEDKNAILYSLHSVDTIYGKVEYAI